MHVVETRHVRKFVVRLEAGEDVAASLHKMAKTELFRAGWLRGRGVVAWADVATWDDGKRAWRPARHLEGPFVLAALEGTITTRIGEPTVEIDVALVREKEGGPIAVGGRLVAASALSVEVLVEVFEDVRLERQDDDALGMAVWRADRVPGVVARARGARAEAAGSAPVSRQPAAHERPDDAQHAASTAAPATRPGAEPATEPGPTSGPVVLSWAAVAEASAESERGVPSFAAPAPAPSVRHAGLAPSFLADRRPPSPLVDEETARVPQRGEWIEHRQFGLCRVEGEDADGGTRVRLPSGARKTLRLDVLEVLPPRHEADRTIYPVRPRAK